MISREALLASWRAAERRANATGRPIVLNHASAAGMLIASHRTVGEAYAACPCDPWWARVREYLILVERAAS